MLAVGATTVVFIRMQNNKMINAKFKETVFLSGIIERTIESSMREGNSAEVARIIDNKGKNREIVSLSQSPTTFTEEELELLITLSTSDGRHRKRVAV